MTDKYAVIGNPIDHSKSPQIHEKFAEQTDQDISYKAFPAPLDGFAAEVERLRKEGYKGCNVTVPFKEHAFQLRSIGPLSPKDVDTEYVDNAKAANTLKFFGNQEIEVYNTDGVGLVRDLTQNLGIDLTGKRLLLMGAGGAASGVLFPLRRALRQADANITIANRTIDRARHLARGTNVSICRYEDLAGKPFDIVINATSSSLSDEMPQLPPGIFASGALAYDMMYGKETLFMKFALAEGVSKDRVVDGLGMLVEQAAESFRIWRGHDLKLNTAPVIAALRKQQ